MWRDLRFSTRGYDDSNHESEDDMRDYDGKTAAQRISERREQLIDAGFVLFGEHGYAGTSIRMVLRQSGLQDRYFAESFEDLDALLAAVHARIVDEELAWCRAAVESTDGSPSDRARAVLEVLMRSLDRDRSRARIKLREVGGAGPLSRAQRRQGMDTMAEMVADLLPEGARRNRRLVALSLVAAAYELMIAWLDGERGLTRKGVVDMVMLLFDSVSAQLTAEAANLSTGKAPARRTPARR
jgi:AcrR family transcriptional regulator